MDVEKYYAFWGSDVKKVRDRLIICEGDSMDKNYPLVSVIIPVYNHAKYLGEAIKSVLKQTYRNYELFVIDDGSTDETKEVVSSFGDRVYYYYQSNRGVSAARNVGIKKARGDFLAFLDADDIWKPNKLTLQIRVLVDYGTTGMVACGLDRLDETGNLVSRYAPKNFDSRDGLLSSLYIEQIIPGSASGVVIRRKCFETVGYFNEELRVGEDWDMWLRIAKKFDVTFVEESLVCLRNILQKPEIRSPKWEEQFVGAVIKKNVPCKYRNRAYGNLYYRLGQHYLSELKRKRALKYFIYSLCRCPTPLYSKIIKSHNLQKVDSRYYLLIRCFLPDVVINKLKNVLS